MVDTVNSELQALYVSLRPEDQGKIDDASKSLERAGIDVKGNTFPYFHSLLENPTEVERLVYGFKQLHNIGLSYNGVTHFCYQALRENPAHAIALVFAFEAFHKADLLFDENIRPQLQWLISHPKDATGLAYGLITFHKANIPFNEDSPHYQMLLEHAKDAANLASGIVIMQRGGILYDETTQPLYQLLLNAPEDAKALAEAFVNLCHAGININLSTLPLFEILCEKPTCAPKLSKVFIRLVEAGIEISEATLPLYHMLKKKTYFAEKPALHFIQLYQAGVEVNENTHPCYQLLLKHPTKAEQLVGGFVVFHKAGIRFNENLRTLYQFLIDNPEHAVDLAKGILVFYSAAIDACHAHYQLLIDNPTHAAGLAKGLVVFHRKKIDYIEDNHARYQLLIDNPTHAENLAKGIAVYYDEDIECDDSTHGLYQPLIDNPTHAENIAKGLAVLVNARIVIPHPFYQPVIDNPEHAVYLAEGLVTLKNAGLDSKHPFYQHLIDNPVNAEKLARGLVLLDNAERALDDNSQALCQMLIDNAHAAYDLAQGLIVLHNAGIDTTDEIYQVLISKDYSSKNIAQCFLILRSVGIVFDKSKLLFQPLLNVSSKVKEAFEALQGAGILPSPSNRVYYETALKACRWLTPLLEKLTKAGYHFDRHPYVFQKFFERIQNENAISVRLIKELNQLVDDFDTIRSDSVTLEEQYTAIDAIFETKDSDRVSFGPLNKQESTAHFETLLTHIINTPVNDITMRFDAFEGYSIELPNAPKIKINLTLLLQNANLSHLRLSEEAIQAIGQKIQLLTINDENDTPDVAAGNPLIQQLPIALQRAVDYYTTRRYKNMNRLFRGLPLDRHQDYVWVKPTCSSQNYLTNLLNGLLLIVATNMSPHVIWHNQNWKKLTRLAALSETNVYTLLRDYDTYKTVIEKAFKEKLAHEVARQVIIDGQMVTQLISEVLVDKDTRDSLLKDFGNFRNYFPDYLLLGRSELLPIEEREKRLTTPQTMPSPTSFSKREKGSQYFQKPGYTLTQMEGDSVSYGVMNLHEDEVVIPPGTQLACAQQSDRLFVAKIVRSPGLHRGEHFISHMALRHAYQNHLKHPYQHRHHRTDVLWTKIYRPNHALAHTYRVMENILVVINYFAHHAKDPDFKRFCQNMSAEEKERLRVAAAFRVTGRESEISARQDPARYNAYKEASVAHFRAFVDTHVQQFHAYLDSQDQNLFQQEAVKARISHIIRYMGHPGYERPFEGNPPINDHEDPEERTHRNYLNRILSLAHNLDLMRCYTPDQYQAALQPSLALSEENDAQAAAFKDMITYNLKLLKAHGNALCTDMNDNGAFVKQDIDYHAPFHRVSHSLGNLFAVSETVAKPKLTESYQFRALEESKTTMQDLCDDLVPGMTPGGVAG